MIRFVGCCCLIAAFIVFLIYPLHILFGLAAIAIIGKVMEKRGWGAEGRLIRYLKRPRFEDEIRRDSRAIENQ
jgi:hypothetical protein